MRFATSLVLLALVGWTISQPTLTPVTHAQPTVVAISTFDTDAEGWTTDADARCRPTPCYAATEGNPGGHIYSDDTLQGIKFYYNAPAKFLGDVSAAYGEHLTFSMRQDARDVKETDDVDVILVGAGLTLVYDTPRNPPSIWFTYDVPLVESAGWRKGNLTGPPPSAAEMQAVLGSLTRLGLRGDFIFGQATSYLDTVVLGGAEIPPVDITEVFLPLVRTSRAPISVYLPLVRQDPEQ
jgi:hypothetical protein